MNTTEPLPEKFTVTCKGCGNTAELSTSNLLKCGWPSGWDCHNCQSRTMISLRDGVIEFKWSKPIYAISERAVPENIFQLNPAETGIENYFTPEQLLQHIENQMIVCAGDGNTLIDEVARAEMGITRDEYAFCNFIFHESAKKRDPKSDWVYCPEPEIAEFVGISIKDLAEMITRMSQLDLIEAKLHPLRLRTTMNWLKHMNVF